MITDRLDVEPHLRSALHSADLSFRDFGEQPHATQIADGEEHGRMHGGRDRLADVHVTADDDAVDRRSNDGAIEADLRLCHGRPRRGDVRVGALHVRRGLLHGCAREVELGARELLIAGQRLGIFQLHARIVEGRLTTSAFGPGLGDPGFRLDETCLEGGRVELRQHLSRLHS